MRLFRTLALVAMGLVGLLFVAAMIVDPRAILLPGWLMSQPWKESCKKDPRDAYVWGSYYPCEGSPFTPENVNQPLSSSKYCPLAAATLAGQIAVADELLSKGANPRLCNGYPKEFFEYVTASSCGNDPAKGREFFEFFKRAGIEPDDPQALLFMSAKGRCAPGIQLALSRGAKVNLEDTSGKSALHYVANSASDLSIEASRMLVEFGANPRLIVSSGETAFDQANRLASSAENWPKLKAALTGTTKP
jgi:hypothetical protein